MDIIHKNVDGNACIALNHSHTAYDSDAMDLIASVAYLCWVSLIAMASIFGTEILATLAHLSKHTKIVQVCDVNIAVESEINDIVYPQTKYAFGDMNHQIAVASKV